MDYFDCDYFDPTYFDTGDCGDTGGHAARAVPLVVVIPDYEDDDLLALV